jgi:hypothetical protein
MVISARATSRRNQRARRQRTVHGGDNDDWTPESHHTVLAAKPVDTERRYTVQEETIRPQGASLVTALRLLPWLRPTLGRILGVELYLSLLIMNLIHQIVIILRQ